MLGLEVVVDRALGDAEDVGDHLERGGVDPVRREEFDGGADDAAVHRKGRPSRARPGLPPASWSRTLADRLTAPSRAASVRDTQPRRRAHMPSARDAKDWAAKGGLHGIGDSLYTPFSGTDGDDIDYDAYRRAGALLRRRPRARRCSGSRAASPSGGRSPWTSARSWSRSRSTRRARSTPTRDPGVHRRDVGEGLRRAHPARAGRRRRHLLHPDAADGGARRRRRAALLPVRRRPHRHRPRHVQLAVVGLRAHARGHRPRSPTRSPRSCATKEGTMEHWRSARSTRWRPSS